MNLKSYILNQLSEIKREIIIAISDLSQESLTFFSQQGHWPIAWIVQHCCGIVDSFIYKHITNKAFLNHDINRIAYPIKIEPQPTDKYPEPSALLQRWSTLLDASIQEVSNLDTNQLNEKHYNHDESIIVSSLRVINHTNAHLKNIYFLLGEQGLSNKFPKQNTWLAYNNINRVEKKI